MLGVIISYPGSSVERFKEVHPGIHFSDDGFTIGHIPTIDAQRKILTYSNKTLVVVDEPATVLWNIYTKYFSELPQTNFLTSVVNGAQRLNFFMAVWLKVAAEKPIKFAYAHDTVDFRSKFFDVFGCPTKGQILPYSPKKPNWDDFSTNIIQTMCSAWLGITEVINGRV